jgi:LysM domain
MSKNDIEYYENLLADLEYIQNNSRGVKAFVKEAWFRAKPYSEADRVKIINLVEISIGKIKEVLQKLNTQAQKPADSQLLSNMASQLKKIGLELQGANNWYRQSYIKLSEPGDMTSSDPDSVLDASAELLEDAAKAISVSPKTAIRSINTVIKSLQGNVKQLNDILEDYGQSNSSDSSDSDRTQNQPSPNQQISKEDQAKAHQLYQNAFEQAKAKGIHDPAAVRDYILQNLDSIVGAQVKTQALLNRIVRAQEAQSNPEAMKQYIKSLLDNSNEYTEAYNKHFQTTYTPSQMKTKLEVPSSQVSQQQVQPTQNKDQSSPSELYVIQSGDTLSGIAKKMQQKYPGITWQDIMEINKGTDTAIADANKIRVNQKIRIPTKPLGAKTPENYQATQKTEKPKQEVQPEQVKQEVQPEQVKQEPEPSKDEKKKTFVDTFKENIDSAINEKNLGKEGDPSQSLLGVRNNMKQIAEKGSILAYSQAFKYLYDKDVLNDTTSYYRKSSGSQRGMTAEDLIALNRSYAQRDYRPGDVRAMNNLTKVFQQAGGEFWSSHEQLVLALRKLVFAKAQKAGVDIATAQNP